MSMTKSEFAEWRSEADRIPGEWVADDVLNGFYGKPLIVRKGGEDGKFVAVEPSGVVRVGDYFGASPDASAAALWDRGEHACGSFLQGVRRVFSALDLDRVTGMLFPVDSVDF